MAFILSFGKVEGVQYQEKGFVNLRSRWTVRKGTLGVDCGRVRGSVCGHLGSPGRLVRLRAEAVGSQGTPHRHQSLSEVAPLAGVVISLAVLNRMLFRMQLVPMRDYSFFVAVLTTTAYILVYSIIFKARSDRGIITDEMRAYARKKWTTFMVIGGLEAVVFAVSFYAGGRIPGSLLAILGQGAVLPLAAIASYVIHGQRFSVRQLLGLGLVLGGVWICISPANVLGSAVSASLNRELLRAVTIYCSGLGFLALSLTLKERLFRSKDLDVFVVNTLDSVFQFLFMIPILPLILRFATTEVPRVYFSNGMRALLHSPAMPWLSILYSLVNIAFNVSILTLTKRSGAVTSVLVGICAIFPSSLVFALKLPFLTPVPLRMGFLQGVALLASGLYLYYIPRSNPQLGSGMSASPSK